ncbi:MAG: site-specific integrase [Paraburkholderia tropica]|nr:site-specific integrase [Paraburkholderia tropica]
MKFDARTASKLAPGDHLTFDGFPGLRLEATQSRRSWIYRYKSPIDQRMRQTKIGEWPAVGFPAAIAEWEKLRTAREEGHDPGATKRARRAGADAPVVTSAYTVKQLCRDYLVGYLEPTRKGNSPTEVQRMFGSLLGAIDGLPAVSITRAQAFDLLEGMRGTPALAIRLRSELGGAWDYALDAGRLPSDTPNWWRLVLRGKLRSKGRVIAGVSTEGKKRVLSDDEIGVLLRWLPNLSQTVADGLTLYLWTGTRGGEIVSIEKSEITEEADGLWWTVPKSKTKNSRWDQATDLRVPLVGRAEEVVRRRMEVAKGDFIFASDAGGAMAQTVIAHGLYYHQPYCKIAPKHERPRIPVTRWSPHDLRRTARTMLASLGCPHEVAEAILGHVLPGVVGVYNKYGYDKERRHWLTLLSQRLEVLAERRPAK